MMFFAYLIGSFPPLIWCWDELGATWDALGAFLGRCLEDVWEIGGSCFEDCGSCLVVFWSVFEFCSIEVLLNKIEDTWTIHIFIMLLKLPIWFRFLASSGNQDVIRLGCTPTNPKSEKKPNPPPSWKTSQNKSLNTYRKHIFGGGGNSGFCKDLGKCLF